MKFVKVNNRIIHFRYLQNEDKPVIVFINSLGTDFRIWEDVVDELRSDYSILLFDKAGHGLSQEPNGEWSMQNYVDDLKELLDELEISKINLVGLSIGGMISILFASQYASFIDKLVLCDTAPKIGQARDWNTRIKTIELKGISFLSEMILERWFANEFRLNNPVELVGYQMMLEKTSAKGYNWACQSIRNIDLTEKMDDISLPVLCICGGEDLSTPPALVKDMAAKISNAKYVEIEGTGHLPCVEKPGLFAKQLLNFLKE